MTANRSCAGEPTAEWQLAGTRKEGDQGVMEDSEELLKALDAKVKDAVRLGWRVVGDVVTGPDGRLNQTMVRVR